MKETIKCIINNRKVETSAPTGMAALDFIRQHQKLPGTKEGCREGECGACTILIGQLKGSAVQYKAVASCLLPLGELPGSHIVTVEGINNTMLTPVQQALTDEGASQCGFCTPGFVVSLTGFFFISETLDFQEAIDALDGNICRCTGYVSIQRAVQQLCNSFAPQLDKRKNRIQQLVQWSILPGYFLEIPKRLKVLNVEVTSAGPPKEIPDSIVVAGATDLYVQQPEELLDKRLEFISHRKGLTGIQRKDNTVYIGAGTTMEEMKHSALINQLFPNMKGYLSLVSSTIMRNRATLAGNIVNASPIGDLTIILLALEADLCLVKGTKKRELPLKKFFKGYKKLDMKKGEIIEAIMFPVPGEGNRFHFEKVSQRKYFDIASCNTAISIKTDGSSIKDIHLSAGGVAPIPLFLEKTCAYLKGKEITDETLYEAMKVMRQEIFPISDIRGSTEYKTLLLRNLIFAHFLTIFPDKNLATDEHG